MFSKQFITIPHSKDLFFRVHSHAFNSFICTLLCENRKRSLILSYGWSNGVVGSWGTWFLDFNKSGAWNKRGGAKFGPFLINIVAEITELWVENSQKINCRDVTSIREGRVKKNALAKNFCSVIKRIKKLTRNKYLIIQIIIMICIIIM